MIEFVAMGNLFDSAKMAEGYAQSRPLLHPQIVEQISSFLRFERPVPLALDIGCGTGLSTAALSRIADLTIGIEPSVAMLGEASVVDSQACFIAGSAEVLPIRSDSVDIATAAGSLNWVDLSLFFPEAIRVLKPGGSLIVYDYRAGRDFRDTDRLSTWYTEFERKFPPPPCAEINPQTLKSEAHGLQVQDHECFDIGLVLTPGFYLEYVLTETNVAKALRNGAAEEDIRSWCEETLGPVFQGVPQEVLFSGFIVYLG